MASHVEGLEVRRQPAPEKPPDISGITARNIGATFGRDLSGLGWQQSLLGIFGCAASLSLPSPQSVDPLATAR